MRRFIVSLLLVASSFTYAFPALATAPVPGLRSCEELKTKPTFGIYSETPYQICTAPPLKLMQTPDGVDTKECFSKIQDLLDACRYLQGAVNAFALSGIYLGKFKSVGEIQSLRDLNASAFVYIDYLRAHLIMTGNGIKAQEVGISRINSFLGNLKTECTTTPSEECNGRLKQLNDALSKLQAMQQEQGKFADALIAVTTGAADSSKTNTQKNDLLETASTQGQKSLLALQRDWPVIQTALNSLTANAPPSSDTFKANRGSALGLLLPLGDISLPKLIARIISQLLGIVGALALVFFIWGGIKYMTAAGDDKKVSDARNMIVAAVSGLAAIFLSYAALTLLINALN